MKRMIGLLLEVFDSRLRRRRGAGALRRHDAPKILSVTREWTKPGKNGPSHEKSESAFVQALTAPSGPPLTWRRNRCLGNPALSSLSPTTPLMRGKKI